MGKLQALVWLRQFPFDSCFVPTFFCRTPEEIKKMCFELEASIVKAQKIAMDYYKIKADYTNTKREADELEFQVKVVEKLSQLLAATLKVQKIKFQGRILDYGMAVKICYNHLISTRGYLVSFNYHCIRCDR